jgi:hypothetical protein
MSRAALVLAFLASLSLAGCARHVVVERSFGRVDGARSISTNSDTEWTIRHPPDPGPSAEP